MSRIGKQTITIPSGVTIDVTGNLVKAKGPKGELTYELPALMELAITDGQISVVRSSDSQTARSCHGLARSMVANLVTGAAEGYKKQLELNGVGFKVQQIGSKLKLSLGFSHDIDFDIPEGVQVIIEKNIITVEGANKQQVGQVAADIRELKKPEPYKGKGIKYIDEYIIRKAGKTAGGDK